MSPGKLENIQVLRALAAISVVMLHAITTSVHYTSSPSRLNDQARYLAFGVDLFFVISGFVIYLTATRSDLSATEFMKRRLLRIVPPYWLLTTIFFACLLLLPGLKAAANAGWPKFLSSLFFVSFARADTPVIYPGWTLEYEMFFYCLTCVALVLSPRRPWAFVSIALCVAALIKPVLHPGASPVLDFLTNSISLSFLAGIVVGQSALKGRPGSVESVALAVALVSVALDDVAQRALYAGLPSAFLLYAALRMKNARIAPWILTVGDASYAIYLVHTFLIAIVGKISQSVLPSLGSELLAATMTVAAVLAGCGFHLWIELPLNKRIAAAFAPTAKLRASV